jgi:hypothetical protein
LADDEEVRTWQEDGWVLVEGLIGTDDIDAAADDMYQHFPSAEAYHADPEGVTQKWLSRPRQLSDPIWPDEGPGFRDEQHAFQGRFPFRGSGKMNRLTVHPSLVNFVERALGSEDVRVYQVGASAKYTGVTNYEQPMHTDRNHSWLPPRSEPPYWFMEGFLYLSDVNEGEAPTHLVKTSLTQDRSSNTVLYMPNDDPELYALERPANGVRGSFLAYRNDVFHRAVDLTAPGGSRFLINVSFKVAGHDWIGYDSLQSHASESEWIRFAEKSSPRELALYGFPEPGHPVWTKSLLAETAAKYPKLDMTPWVDSFEEGG